MRKTNFIAFVAFCSIMLVSCSKPMDITLTPKSTQVKGELKEYFTVVDKNYIVKYDKDSYPKYKEITIELQRTGVPFAFNKKGIEPVGHSGAGVLGNFGIGIKIYDADNNIIKSVSPTADGLSGVYSSDDLKNLLILEENETGIVRWTSYEFQDLDIDDKNFTFEISSSLEFIEQAQATSSSYNSLYDAYEDAVNETARAMKNAQEEAARAMQEAQKEASRMMKEAQRQAGYDYDDDEW